MQRESVEGMINNFGQTPTQLLRKAHPKRKLLQDVDAGKVRVIKQIEKQIDPRFALIEVLFDSISILYFAALCLALVGQRRWRTLCEGISKFLRFLLPCRL